MQENEQENDKFIKDAVGITQADFNELKKQLDDISKQGLTDPRNTVGPKPKFGKNFEGAFSHLSVPELNDLKNSTEPVNTKSINFKEQTDGVKEAADNSVISKKVRDADGNLVEWKPEEWQNSPFSFLGYNNVLYQKQIINPEDHKLIERSPMAAMAKAKMDDETEYEYLVPSYDNEGTPYLQIVKGTRDSVAKQGYNILNKYGVPDESNNFTYSFMASAANTLGQTDDLLISFMKFSQDGGKLLTGSRNFEEETILDKMYRKTIEDTKQTDFLTSVKSNEFGSWDWFGSGTGSAMASLVQFGGVGKGIRAGTLGIKELIGAAGKSSLGAIEKTAVTQAAKDAVVNKVSSWGSSGIIGFGHAYNDALQNGLDVPDAWTYGLLVGGINSAIEGYLGADFDKFLTGGGHKLIAKDILKELNPADIAGSSRAFLKKNGKQFVETVGTRFKNMGIEGSEEVLQDITEQAGKIFYDNMIKEEGEKGFNHSEYKFQQTLTAGIFGALAAAPFNSARTTMMDRVMNGESKEVDYALDDLLAQKKISKVQHTKLKKEKELFENIMNLNRDVIDGISGPFKQVIFGEIAGLINQRMDLEQENDKILKGLKDVPLADVKEDGTEIKAKQDANNLKIKEINDKIGKFKDSAFLKSRVGQLTEASERVNEVSNNVFKFLNANNKENLSSTQEQLVGRVGTLGAESFLNAKLVRTPAEATLAIQSINDGKLKPEFKDVVVRDIAENFLYLSPTVNTDENRAFLLSAGITEDKLPLTATEKADVKANPEKYKGRFLDVAGLNQVLSAVTEEDLNKHYNKKQAIAKYGNNEKLNYVLENREKLGITDAMLASLDNRGMISALFDGDQATAVNKILDHALPSSLFFADGLTPDVRGAFDNSNRFLYVSGQINELLKSKGTLNNKEKALRDSLFHGLVHEAGHGIFDKELDRMFQSWKSVQVAGTKRNADFHIFDRLYRLAMLSHKALGNDNRYSKQYFKEIADAHVSTNHVNAEEKADSALGVVREFYAEALANKNFQVLLDEFNLADAKNKSLLTTSGYNFTAPEANKHSILAEVLKAVSAVFHKLQGIFDRKERTLLTEAFILGSNINYNEFTTPDVYTKLVNKSISLYAPVSVFEEGEIHDGNTLTDNLLSRLEKRNIQINKESRESLYNAVKKFVVEEMMNRENGEYISGTAVVVFFKNTNDFMISYRTSSDLGGGDTQQRAFFGLNGNRRFINTNTDNQLSSTTISKPRFSTAFADLNDKSQEFNRSILNAYDKANKEGFLGESWLELNENHIFKLNGEEIRGAVNIVYRFADGTTNVIGFVPDLAKLRLSQILNEGVSVKVKISPSGAGSRAYVKRDEVGNIVNMKPSNMEGLNPNEYSLESGMLSNSTFRYVPGITIAPELKALVNKTDSLTADDENLKPLASPSDFLTTMEILRSGRVRERKKGSFSLYNPTSSNDNKVDNFEPGTAESAVKYIQDGLKRFLTRANTWSVGKKLTNEDLADLSNDYNEMSKKYLAGKFEPSPVFDWLGFDNESDYADFSNNIIDEIKKTFESPDASAREDWEGMGGDPAGKISFAIRADLNAINYEYAGSKHWLDFSEGKAFLFEAAENTMTFDAMIANLKTTIDGKRYGGAQLVQAKAIYDHLTKDRSKDSDEFAVFEEAKKTYWSQFGSYVRLDALTISSQGDTSNTYINGERAYLKQLSNDFQSAIAKKINEVKDRAQQAGVKAEDLFKSELNEFFVRKYAAELSEQVSEEEALAVAQQMITTQTGKTSDVLSMIRAKNTLFKDKDYRNERLYYKRGEYEAMKQLTKGFYAYLGIQLPDLLFAFDRNVELQQSIQDYHAKMSAKGISDREIENNIKIAMKEKNLSLNKFVEVDFKSKNEDGKRGQYPFIMLGMQAAAYIGNQIKKSANNEKHDYNLSEFPDLARAVMRLSGNYRSPEFYFNAKFEKEWAYKTKSYLDTTIRRLSDPNDELLSKYSDSPLYKNNRFLESIRNANGEAVQVMVSGVTNADQNGKSYAEAIQMDYLYANLGAFVWGYEGKFYYHVDDVPSDKPRNMAFRMLRMKPEELTGEIQKIIDTENVRLKSFEKRFNAAFKNIGDGKYQIKDQKAFDSLPAPSSPEKNGPLYRKVGDAYVKGWGFDPTNNFYEGKDAAQITALINKEAEESFKKWSGKMSIPVSDRFLKELERDGSRREQKLAKEREKIYKEWFINSAINRYHVSQVTMGDNIYYEPGGLVELSKRHAGTSAPSVRGSLGIDKIKVAILEDVVSEELALPLMNKLEDGTIEIDGDHERLLGSVKSTDAQGYVTEDFALAIKKAYGQDFSPYEKVFKPVVFGLSEDKIKDGQPLYLKLSLAILPNPANPENDKFYQEQPDLFVHANKLYASGSHMAVFQTGVKVGGFNVTNVGKDAYNTMEFDSTLFGLQNNPYHDPNSDENYLNGLVQMTKQLGDNGNAKDMASYHEIEGQVADKNAQHFLDNTFGHYKKLNEVIREELARNDWSNPLSNFIDDDIQILDNPITARMAENFINARFKKQVSLAKKDGDKLVNLSNFGMGRPTMSKEDAAQRKAILQSMSISGSQVGTKLLWAGPRKPESLLLSQLIQLQNEIASGSKSINPEGYILDANKAIVIYPTEALVPEGENYAVGDRIIAVRIPTSKKSNVIPAIVIGHTHPSQGNLIVVSEEGPAILGFDFDVDGLFVWREKQREANSDITKMFDAAFKILTNPSNYNEMTSPVNTDGIKKLAEKIDELKAERNKNKFAFSKWSPERQLELKTLNSIGKDMISLGANYSGIHSIFSQNGGSPFISSMLTIRGYNYNGRIHSRFISSYEQDGNEVLVSDIFSEFINAATDNAKLQLLGRLGLNPFLARTAFDMIAHGIPVEYAVLFVNQPVIQSYNSLNDTQNASSFSGNQKDIPLHLVSVLEAEIQKLDPKYADYRFDKKDAKGLTVKESKAIRRYVMTKFGRKLSSGDNVNLSQEALENGIKGVSNGMGSAIEQQFNLLETQLVVLDKFRFYQSLASITRKAGSLVTLTSNYPKTFIELVQRQEDIREVAVPEIDELTGDIIIDAKIDINSLLYYHGMYKVQWSRLNDLISAYSRFKLYANPTILEVHKSIAGGHDADLQQKVMEDFYTYLLQFSEESDNDNHVYNLSTSSLLGHRIDPYLFVQESAGVINALKEAYPENEFLRLLKFKENIKSQEQVEDRGGKPNQILSQLEYEPDANTLELIRRDFLALPTDVVIQVPTLEGEKKVSIARAIPSIQDLVLGHLLHTQGFRMGGFSFSKVLPIETTKFIDQQVSKWKEDLNTFNTMEELPDFVAQVKLNHPELIREFSREAIIKGTQSTIDHFDKWDRESIIEGATYTGLLRRNNTADGGEEISIMSRAKDSDNQALIETLTAEGVVRMEDASGRTQVYKVSGPITQKAGKYDVNHILLRTVNFIPHTNVKQYEEEVYLSNLSNNSVKSKVYLFDNWDQDGAGEFISQEIPEPIQSTIVNAEINYEKVLSGAQTGITTEAFPDVVVGDVIELPTEQGNVLVRVTSAPYSLQDAYNKLVLNNLNEGERLIHEHDVRAFNAQLQKDGKKPERFFTRNTKFKNFFDNARGVRGSQPDNTTWTLNEFGLYDLVDLESGEVFYKDVDLQSGTIKVIDGTYASLMEDFVTHWAKLEGKKEADFNDLMAKFQFKFELNNPPEEVLISPPTELDSRIGFAIEKIKSLTGLEYKEKEYFISKLNSAKSDADVDALADELITKCKS